MAEKTFVVFINIITDDCFLTLGIVGYRFLETIYNLFQNGERVGVNATRLAVRALELRIIDLDNLAPDEE